MGVSGRRGVDVCASFLASLSDFLSSCLCI